MNIIILSVHDATFQPIANLTVPHMIEYCQRHDYKLKIDNCVDAVDTSSKQPFQHIINHRKLMLIKNHILSQKYDWVFWLDTDALIMNMTIKLEYFIDNNYDLIIGEDWNGINAGVFFIKSCQASVDFIDSCIQYKPTQFDKERTPYWWWPSEQCAITRCINMKRTRIVHHSLFNGYIIEPNSTNMWPQYDIGPFDKNFKPKVFTHGDFIIHFVSYDIPHKVAQISHYIKKIIR